MDIHLDLDLIKNAQAMDQDLDNKSLLALCLVLLKQVQPYVTDFEAQESKFMQNMSQMQSQFLNNNEQSDGNTQQSSIIGGIMNSNITNLDDGKRQNHSSVMTHNETAATNRGNHSSMMQ